MNWRRQPHVGLVVFATLAFGLSAPAIAGTISTPTSSGAVRVETTVAKAVAQGLKVKQIPLTLSPSLAHVAANTYRQYSSRCSSTSGRCVIGSSKTKKSMVVFGDSHAQQWLPPIIDRFAAHYRITALFNTQCSPAAVDVLTTSEQIGSTCGAWRDATLKNIASLKPTIILVAESTYRRQNADGSPVSTSTWSTGLLSTLTQLKSSGAKVALIGDNPTFQNSPTACLKQHATNVQVCTKNPAKQPAEYQYMVEAETNAASSAGVGYIDTTKWFCKVSRTSTLCPAIIANMLPYSDASHVSLTYSHYLAAALHSAVLNHAK